MATDQNNEKIQWTWRDTLDRIQYIDTIISQIVSGAVLFDTALLAVFGALYYVFYTQTPADSGKTIVRWSIVIVSILGFIINLMLTLNLFRQEYNRQWYFHIFPDNLPLKPHEKWLKSDITPDIKSYDVKPKPELIPKCRERIRICKFGGKLSMGYCASWIGILSIIAIVFLILARISWGM